MKKIILTSTLIVILSVFAFTLIGCADKEETVGIDRFEIQELVLTEGDTFDTSKVVIDCYKTDGTTAKVTNNLTFDKAALETKIDAEDVLSENSAGEYTIPVYHIGMHIGDLKLTVKVKR
ncbi:MAG: hypothetical protein PHC84_06165 [Clostridia bacterium]|nr:hypothetical protein [Clostridia bacterium]